MNAAQVDRQRLQAVLDVEQLLAVLEVEQMVLVARDGTGGIAAQVARRAAADRVDDLVDDILGRNATEAKAAEAQQVTGANRTDEAKREDRRLAP